MADRESVGSGACTAGGFADLFWWNWSRKSKAHHIAGKGHFHKQMFAASFFCI